MQKAVHLTLSVSDRGSTGGEVLTAGAHCLWVGLMLLAGGQVRDILCQLEQRVVGWSVKWLLEDSFREQAQTKRVCIHPASPHPRSLYPSHWPDLGP